MVKMSKDDAVMRAVALGLFETKTAARKVAVDSLIEAIVQKEQDLYEAMLATPAEIEVAVREQAEDERSNDAYEILAAEAAGEIALTEDEGEAVEAAVRECCQGHPAGPFDPRGETMYCDGSCVKPLQVNVGGPYDRVANLKQPEAQKWVDMVVETHAVWPEPTPAPEPMAMNRHQRRRMAALTQTRAQRLASRA